ncbi:MAG: CDP-alcohol phosphatidyltransferase family protein [Deltaproteobacteria bacterium]|nr:CDP-alcohol phosphatidyltransferase family protein [Deltaproteobacteria bacterium]
MRALLLAGARLPDGAPAAALRVAGLSLLERALFVARDAGVTSAVVVADAALHGGLRAAVRRQDVGVELTFADPASERDRILAGLGVGDPVAVVAADVAHTRHASPALKGARPGDVLLEEKPESGGGPDALRLGAGRTWLGLAVLGPERLGGLLEAAARDPAGGAAGALGAELSGGGARGVPVPGLAWQLVRGAADAKAARRMLFGSLVKPADGWISRHLNRPISLSVSRVLVGLPVHPNHLSVLVFLISMAGCACVAWGDHYWLPILGAFLVQWGSILDGCDGELARLRYQGSLLGAWLDNAGDDLTTVVYSIAVAVNLGRFGHSPVWTWLGAATAVFALIAIAVSYTYIVSIGSGCVQDFPSNVERAAVARTPLRKLWGFIAYLSKRDTMDLIFLGLAVLGLLEVIATLFFLGAAATCFVFVRRRVEMRREARAGVSEGCGGA